jgi:enoyl-[acyl-carrier protein] reductase II
MNFLYKGPWSRLAVLKSCGDADMNELTEMLGCRYPIIQGAMGVISNPELVAAVSEAGGFGLLATAFLSETRPLIEQLEAVRRLTDRPFGANLMAMNPLSEEFARILADFEVRAVTLSGGSPKSLIPILKERGIKTLCVISNVATARKAESLGTDAVIAEGSESGGIQGFNGPSTFVLVPMVADAVNLPVVAAGGIADSRGYRAALALGAKGVQVGTRFIASEECIAHENYKKALCEAADTDTILISRGRFQVRVISTPLAQRLQASNGGDVFDSLAGRLEDAWIRGDLDAYTIPAGQVAGLVREVKPVRDIIAEMVAGG